MSGVDGDAVELRRADASDAAELADLFWTVRRECEPAIPPMVHPRESVLPWLRDVVLAGTEVWVAQTGDGLAGLLSLAPPDRLEHLYLLAAATGQGLGGRLLALARERMPGGLQLWTFRSNTGARRFYERHGFVAVEWTDGDNEEGEPDVRYVWSQG